MALERAVRSSVAGLILTLIVGCEGGFEGEDSPPQAAEIRRATAAVDATSERLQFVTLALGLNARKL